MKIHKTDGSLIECTVEEYLQLEQINKPTKNSPTKETIQYINKLTKKRPSKPRIWNAEEIKQLKENAHLDAITLSKQIITTKTRQQILSKASKYGGLRKLRKKILHTQKTEEKKIDGRTLRNRFITTRANYLCKNNPYITRERAWIQASDEWNNNKKTQINTNKRPEYDEILKEHNQILYDMLKNISQNKEKLNLNSLSILIRTDKEDWTKETYANFLAWFVTNSENISKELNIKNKYYIKNNEIHYGE